MALDTADRRASALGRGLPFLTVTPLPDAVVSTGDRLQLAWLYRGIEPVEVETPPERILSVRMDVRVFVTAEDPRVFSVRRDRRIFEVT